MPARTLYFVIPGDLETRTGGYGYDRAIIDGLLTRGWTVHVVALEGHYPAPDTAAHAYAARALGTIPDDALVLVDGLALGALPHEASAERDRLRLVGLVHHPLGLETGVDAATSERLLESERQALAAVRGVVVTSWRTVTAVEALGIAPDRIAVVEPGTAPAAAALPFNGGTVQMLCVASISPRKAHDVLFDALESLTRFDWHLTCAGRVDRQSAYASSIATRAVRPPLGGRITMAGELTGAVLDATYAAAHLFVLPTHYEGYGMAVAEALARGIPVISTATGAIVELVGDDAGMLVPPGDVAALAGVLATTLSDPAQLARMRAGAMARRASLPTWNTASAAMEEALVRFRVR